MPSKPVLLILLGLLLLLGPLFNASSAQAPFVLKLESYNLVPENQIKFSYSGFNANDCLVVLLRKGSSYLKDNPGLSPACYTDDSTYRSFISNTTGSFFVLTPLEIGNYDIAIRDYKRECALLDIIRCDWKLLKTSNTVKFNIVADTSPFKNPSTLTINPPSGKAGESFIANLSLRRDDGSPVQNQGITLTVPEQGSVVVGKGVTDGSGDAQIDISVAIENFPKGKYTVSALTGYLNINPTTSFEITQEKNQIDCTPQKYLECQKMTPPQACYRETCVVTLGAAGQPCADGVITAIGCIPTNPGGFVNAIVKFVVAAAGGIAFILMLFGTFQMVTSAGNQETLKTGQELFTNAIIGLLFIAFSVLLMQIIGVDILNIPGFGK